MSNLRLFPPNFRTDPVIKALSYAMDRQFERLKVDIYDHLFIYDIDAITDENLLLHFALQLRVEGFSIADSIQEKKELIKNALEVRRHKGTKYSILKVFEAINIDIIITEWPQYDGEPYNFKIDLMERTRQISVENRLKLIGLIEKYKNVRSHMEDITLCYLVKHPVEIYYCGNFTELYADSQMITERRVEVIHNKILSVGCMAETGV